MSIVILLVSGCNVLKFVPDDKSLVDANFVKIEGGEKIEDIKEQIILQPNRKMLGLVKFNLWSYYVGQKLFKRDSIVGRIVTKEGGKKTVRRGKKPNKTKKIFTEIIGEKPVYLDSVLIVRSEKNLKQFLYQKGYYNVKVESKVITLLKRSYITYTIAPGTPYVIRKIEYNGSDRLLDLAANEFKKESILKIGDKVDAEQLSLERDRLTSDFRNNGYYYFNKAFIEILADSGGHDKGSFIYFLISNPGAERNARQQTIEKVVVEMDFKQQFGRRDTLTFPRGENGIKYLFNGYDIKPNIINRSVILRPKDLFSQKKLEESYNKLIGLGLFRQVSISVLPYKSDTTGKVLVYIKLTPSAKHDYGWELQAMTSDKQTDLNSQDNNPRNYGVAGTARINNKNVFRNAEDFNIKFRMAGEKQFGNNSGIPVPILGREFSAANYESNLTFELLFPKLVGLRKLDLKPYLQKNRTSLNFTYQVEKNTSYSRNSVPINFTWQTSYKNKKKQSFNFFYSPLQLSFNKAEVNSDFLTRLSDSDSIRISKLFRNYIIPSQKFSMVFNNMNQSPSSYWNIRSNLFELSGNLIEFGFRKFSGNYANDKGLFGIPYFQYFRTDIDAVKYRVYGKNKALVMRANIGYGLPFGNSVIMPFERQFFVGGSNSLRGWRPRVLGPGNYNNSSTIQIDKTGDMMIVTNVEYRFAIAPGTLEGAVFIDAGNIWEVTKSAADDSKFKFGSFYNQLAVNTGLGFRFDLEFFILRLDFGIPLHDPSELKDERWVIKDLNSFKWLTGNVQPLLAVGYPF